MNLFQEFLPVSEDTWLQQIEADLKGKPLESLLWKPETGIQVKPWASETADLAEVRRGNLFNRMDNGWQIAQSLRPSPHAAELLEIALKSDIQAIFWQGEADSVLEKLPLPYFALHIQSPTYTGWSAFFAQQLLQTPEVLTGTFTSTEKNPTWKPSFAFAKEMKASPWFRALGLNLAWIHNEGGSIVQQLAAGLSLAVDAIEAGKAEGWSVEEICEKMAVHFATSGQFFVEIAKYRAWRVLWSKMLSAYAVNNPEAHSPYLVASTSLWNKGVYDAYSHLLRCTGEGMAAILGGTNALVIENFDQKDTAFSSRMARNIQHLLKHESYLDKVTDAAGGSYYIEQLSAQLCEAAWQQFLEWEDAGGYAKAFPQIESAILAHQAEQLKSISRRKIVSIGANQYPNTEETQSETQLSRPHLTQELDKIRQRVDLWAKENERRPCAWLLTFGDVAMRNARALFARNVIACGGFAIVEAAWDNAPTTAPDLIVFCASDADYATEISEQLNQARAHFPEANLLIAGKPEGWENWGIADNLYAGMELVPFLEKITEGYVGEK